ncbi:MAG TPA: methyltransferase domain-containing protein [Bryobacteraceae bacterium]|nr:methyltransferase domain-containing protein [Bryobacteraceae bacterium]
MTSDRIEQWNQRYRAGEQVFDAPTPLVARFTADLAPGLALDLACGTGRNALYLAGHGWRVTAVDGSPVAIDLLLARAGHLALDARVVDLETEPFEVEPESYNLILSCYYLQRSLIPVMQSALRAGGLLIMIVRLGGEDQPQGTPTRAYRGELRAFFDDWRILHYREGEAGNPDHPHTVGELVAQKPA